LSESLALLTRRVNRKSPWPLWGGSAGSFWPFCRLTSAPDGLLRNPKNSDLHRARSQPEKLSDSVLCCFRHDRTSRVYLYSQPGEHLPARPHACTGPLVSDSELFSFQFETAASPSSKVVTPEAPWMGCWNPTCFLPTISCCRPPPFTLPTAATGNPCELTTSLYNA